jgi:hypothetical protein
MVNEDQWSNGRLSTVSSQWSIIQFQLLNGCQRGTRQGKTAAENRHTNQVTFFNFTCLPRLFLKVPMGTAVTQYVVKTWSSLSMYSFVAQIVQS